MNTTIQLKVNNVREANRLLKFYSIERSRVKAQMQELMDDDNRIEENINSLRRQIDQIEAGQLSVFNTIEIDDPERQTTILQSKINLTGFELSWTITNKAIFILREAGQVLTINEIVERLEKYEPISGISERQLKANYSSTLGVKAKQGKIFGRTLIPGTNDYYYGLTPWFLKSGEVKDEYRRAVNNQAPELTEA